MPSRKLTNWIDGYLEFCKNTEPSTILHEWVAVSVIASALQRKCWFELGILKTYPNFYIVLATPPGFRKGTAMDIGESLLRNIGGNIKLAASATTKEALIGRLADCLVMEPPTADGVIISHSSLTVYSEELTVFLGYNNVNFMSILCNWFDCKDSWSDDTIKHGSREVQNLWVNILGATTPDLVQSSLPRDSIGSGLTSRMIFVYSDAMNFVPVPSITPHQAKIYKCLSIDLERIHTLRGQFKFTKQWQDDYIDWRVSEQKNPSVTDRSLAYYTQRRPVHILKLSMIMAASRCDDLVVDADDLRRAIDLLHRTEKRMPRVFAGVGRSSVAEVTSRIITYIATKGSTSSKDILGNFMTDLEGIDQLEGIIKSLQYAGLISISYNQNGGDTITFKRSSKTAAQYAAEQKVTV